MVKGPLPSISHLSICACFRHSCPLDCAFDIQHFTVTVLVSYDLLTFKEPMVWARQMVACLPLWLGCAAQSVSPEDIKHTGALALHASAQQSRSFPSSPMFSNCCDTSITFFSCSPTATCMSSTICMKGRVSFCNASRNDFALLSGIPLSNIPLNIEALQLSLSDICCQGWMTHPQAVTDN